MANSIWQATIQNEAGDIIPGAEITVTDEDTGLPATIFSTIGGAAKSNPFFADSNGFAQFYAGSGTYRVNAEDTGTGQSQLWRYIRFGDSASRDVGTSAGQLMEAGAGGLLGNAAVVNLAAAISGGRIFQAVSGSPISGLTVFGIQSSTGDGATAARFMGRGDRAFYEGFGAGATDAKELYHSGNLNPNVFGGVALGDYVSVGEALSATVAAFFLPVSLLNAPSSITVLNTFTAENAGGGTVYGSGLTPVINAASGNKIAYITVSGLSGLVVKDPVYLRQENASSTITVNP